MGEDAIEILYPEMTNFAEQYNQMAYRNLDADMLDYLLTPSGRTSRSTDETFIANKNGLLQIAETVFVL